ncbi:hypothetical protein NB705_003168 [Xanthomonas sacchari]|nr:hypothetical protein [Xanthomonas sacchari]
MGGEQLGLHHRVDRGVAGEDDEAGGEDGEGAQPVALPGQLQHQEPGVEHAADAEEHQQGLAPDQVRQPAAHRLHQHQHDQRGQVDDGAGHDVVAGEGGLDHLRPGHRVGVERHGAAGGDQEAQQQRAPLVHEQLAQRAGGPVLALLGRGDGLGGQRLVHRAPQPEHHQRADAAQAEGHAPAPFGNLALVEEVQHPEQHRLRQHVAADQGDVVEGGQEAAPPRDRRLGHIGGAGAVLAAGGETLQQARQQQHHRRGAADAGHGGRHRNQERTGRHHRHRHRQRQAAAVAVGETAEVPGADRTHQEGHREDRPHVQRGVLVLLGEELRFEVGGEHRVDVDVVPLHQVAGRALERVGHRAAQAARCGGGGRRGGCTHAVGLMDGRHGV